MKLTVAYRLIAARRRLEAAMWRQRIPVLERQWAVLRGTYPEGRIPA